MKEKLKIFGARMLNKAGIDFLPQGRAAMNEKPLEANMNYNMTDYLVYYQTYNSKTKEWDYKNRIFNSVDKAKKFGAEILKVDPENGVMIRSKEYKIFYEDGFPVKRYLGQEQYIVNSTSESHKNLLKELITE